jgi:hypothetical protein
VELLMLYSETHDAADTLHAQAAEGHEMAKEVEELTMMSRRRFLELGLGIVAGLSGGASCGRARRIARGPREHTGGQDEERERRRGAGRGFGLGRLLRRLF